jgi:hypothetical protein
MTFMMGQRMGVRTVEHGTVPKENFV